ncbi:MAG TPA: DUF4337 domain-containing protein [Minicystis sp.]|nr:DUF4337 domain-containing protein [Minicystis sp.]
MGEIADHINEAIEKASESRLNTVVAAAVAVTATFMALCNVKDDNIVQSMHQAQARSVDAWAYYQAKSTKQHLAEQMVDQLTVERDAIANLTIDGRALFERRIIDYTAQVTLYEDDKGEIKKQAEGFQKQYDDLNYRDDQFDMAEASCSIAIAMFGVTALTQKKFLLAFALFFAVFGSIVGVAGFAGWGIHPDFLVKLLS